jgi:hypothetical protein
VQITPAPVTKAPAAPRANDYQPMLVAHSYRLNSAPTVAELATARSSLGWMNQVQLAPLPQTVTAEELIFEPPAPLRPDQIDQNLFRSRLPVPDTKVQQSAFQFQR